MQKDMQDRPRFTGTLIISTLIHFAISVPSRIAALADTNRLQVKTSALFWVCYVYVPFAVSGCVIGLHPHLIRPVLAALLSASFVFVLIYMRWNMLAAPAILFSTLGAFLTRKHKNCFVSKRHARTKRR